MGIKHYDPASRILITEEPSFPNEDELKEAPDGRPDFITIQEWQTYYIKFYGKDIPSLFERAPFVTKSFKSLGFFEINFKNRPLIPFLVGMLFPDERVGSYPVKSFKVCFPQRQEPHIFKFKFRG